MLLLGDTNPPEAPSGGQQPLYIFKDATQLLLQKQTLSHSWRCPCRVFLGTKGLIACPVFASCWNCFAFLTFRGLKMTPIHFTSCLVSPFSSFFLSLWRLDACVGDCCVDSVMCCVTSLGCIPSLKQTHFETWRKRRKKLLHWNILLTCRNVWAICVVSISLEYSVHAAHMGPTKVFNHAHNSLRLHFWMWNFMQLFILCFIF